MRTDLVIVSRVSCQCNEHARKFVQADHPLNWWPSGTGNGTKIFQGALLAFYRSIVEKSARPSFTWQFENNGLSIIASNFSDRPQVVSWAEVKFYALCAEPFCFVS